MPYALIDRARLLCAHATFVRPWGRFSEYDALTRHASVQARRRAIAALTY